MSEELQPFPTTAVNAAPDVMSALMELDPRISDEILNLVCGIEEYKNIRRYTPRQFEIGIESEDSTSLFSRMLDALIKFIIRFMKDISDGTATLSFSLGKLVNRAELINTESRASRRTNRKDTFTIDTRIHNLCMNYRPVSDPQQLLMILRSNDNVIKNYIRYQNVDLPAAINGITRIDPKTPESVLNMIELLTPISPCVKAKAFQFTGDQSVMSSVQLLGNQRLHAMSKNPTGDAVEQLAGQEWLLLAASDQPRPLPTSITYNTFASTIEQSIIRQVIATTTDLESNFGIVSRNNRAIKVDTFTRYLDRLRTDITNGNYDNEATVRAGQIIRMLEAYSSWLINPYLNVIGLYIRNTNAVLNVCAANN